MEWIDFDVDKFDAEKYIRAWQKEKDPLKKGIAKFLEEWYDDSVYITIQSSGTTGAVRSFEVLKEHMEESAKMTASFFNFKKADTALLCLSMNFIAGKMMVVRSIVSELKLAISNLDANPLKNLVSEIDFCPMVPMQVENSVDKIYLIKQLLIGGASLNEELEAKVASIHTAAFMSFGMAETLSHIAIRKLGAPNTTFQILNNVIIEANGDNCLVISAPKIGVEKLVTKDLIELLDATRFKWLGRSDNLINSGGVKIIPELVEGVLKEAIPGLYFFIGSIPDKRLGEKVVLLIESKNGLEEQINFSKKMFKILGLSVFEIPKEVLIVSKFERTESRKIKRKSTLENLKNSEILYQVRL